ncbi:MAG: dockerin type I repeat-containing protein [Ruminococcus sp.]|nr:dockerin type I repeat-containing protein [Ruminococcus sp.]
MNKKVLSFVCSVLLAVCSAVPATVNADTGHNFNADDFKDCVELGDTEWGKIWGGRYERIFLEPREDSMVLVHLVESDPDSIQFKIDKSIDEKLIEQIIKEVDSGFVLTCFKTTSTDEYNCTVHLRDSSEQYAGIDSKTAKQLYNALSEYAVGFDYEYGRYTYNTVTYEYLTGYDPFFYRDEFTAEEIEEMLNDYVKNNNINAFVEQKSDSQNIYLVPENTDIIEHYRLALDIFEKTGLRPDGVMPEGTDNISDGIIIDVANSVDGDANCDGATSISDAVAVLQYLANSEKYQLTEQGVFNADTDCNGITGADAAYIQMIDAEVI